MTDNSDLPEVDTHVISEQATGGGGTATVTVDDVTEAMKDVVDPELGINVVDLGLERVTQACVVGELVVVQDDLLVERVERSVHRFNPP